MNRSQWLAIIAGVMVIIGCFIPWVHITDPSLTISGIETYGTRFGKPAYNHFILTTIILICTFVPHVGVKRFNLLFGALNLAWAVRNFVVIPMCDGGICPQKLMGLYLVLLGAIILMLTTLFPKDPIKKM